MVDNETLIKLRSMRLSGMAECLENLAGLPQKRTLSASDVVKLICDHEWNRHQSSKLKRLHILIDRRHRRASTIFCTQLSASDWHDQIEEKVIADAIVDR